MQRLDPLAACERVVSGAAVFDELDRTGGQAGGVHGVGAREGVELEPVVGDLRMEDLNGRGETGGLHAVSVSTDVDRVVAGGAVDDDAVSLAVAGRSAEGACEVDVHSA